MRMSWSERHCESTETHAQWNHILVMLSQLIKVCKLHNTWPVQIFWLADHISLLDIRPFIHHVLWLWWRVCLCTCVTNSMGSSWVHFVHSWAMRTYVLNIATATGWGLCGSDCGSWQQLGHLTIQVKWSHAIYWIGTTSLGRQLLGFVLITHVLTLSEIKYTVCSN